jgi:uncharacterized protein YjiS (DUF1127 family)
MQGKEFPMPTHTAVHRFRDVSWLTRLGHMLAELGAGIREGREMETRYFELSRLSDAELSRRGLRREDIARVAVTGRAGW